MTEIVKIRIHYHKLRTEVAMKYLFGLCNSDLGFVIIPITTIVIPIRAIIPKTLSLFDLGVSLGAVELSLLLKFRGDFFLEFLSRRVAHQLLGGPVLEEYLAQRPRRHLPLPRHPASPAIVCHLSYHLVALGLLRPLLLLDAVTGHLLLRLEAISCVL